MTLSPELPMYSNEVFESPYWGEVVEAAINPNTQKRAHPDANHYPLINTQARFFSIEDGATEPSKIYSPSEAFDIEGLPIGAIIRFYREVYRAAAAKDQFTARRLVRINELTVDNFFGLKGLSRPHNYFLAEEMLHVESRYEFQKGLAVLLNTTAGGKAFFGLHQSYLELARSRHQSAISPTFPATSRIETSGYEYHDLSLPLHQVARVGISSQHVFANEPELVQTQIERIRQFEVFK